MGIHQIEENIVNYPVAILAKRLLQRFRESLDEQLRPSGITAAQVHILAKLEAEPGISGARLARVCSVTPQTTQVLLRGIEANGWIVRRKHPENERILLATLTPTGRRQLARSRIVIGHIYEGMLDGLPTRHVRQLENLLTRCAANLESNRTGATRKRRSAPASRTAP